jgi:hypothetical protein
MLSIVAFVFDWCSGRCSLLPLLCLIVKLLMMLCCSLGVSSLSVDMRLRLREDSGGDALPGVARREKGLDPYEFDRDLYDSCCELALVRDSIVEFLDLADESDEFEGKDDNKCSTGGSSRIEGMRPGFTELVVGEYSTGDDSDCGGLILSPLGECDPDAVDE